MGKRKQSDLRTSPIPLMVHRYDMKQIRNISKDVWGIDHLQPFFPPIEKLFKTEVLSNPKEFGVKFDEQIVSILDENNAKLSNGKTVQIHKKITMLLSPFKWMQGDYGTSFGLPSLEEEFMEMQKKIQNPNNAAYIGAIVSAVLSQSGCRHFPKTYGLFIGVSDKHTIDISDDYGDLCERSWFSQNIGKTFDMKLADDSSDNMFKHTRTARAPLEVGEDTTLENVEEYAPLNIPETNAGEISHVTQTQPLDDDDDESDSSSVSTSYVFEVKSCDCDSDEEDDDDESEGEPFAWASFKNVPVQITLMEKCDGTFFELCSETSDEQKHLAWLAQVMFALAFAQRNFSFTHNDLHSNNVMHVSTKDEFLYYNCEGKFYKVPTYGKLIKIIDFERCVSNIRVVGMKDAKVFMSDHFNVDEEAGGQYNCDPEYIARFPVIKPNPSFDLVRLATSMFWDLFPDGPECLDYRNNTVFKFFTKWLKLEDGSSVMFGKKDLKHDRYHGFHLYKAIARFSKDAVPRNEIEELNMFKVDSIPAGSSVCSIEN
jgi:hypothetical protein